MAEVTLADVARRAGVSTATVSRVLSGSRPVGVEAVRSVRRAADELGYSGNVIARALRSRRTGTVGMIVPSILNPFFTSLVDAMERALHSRGRTLLLADSRDDPAVEAAQLASFRDGRVDGIVISPCHEVDSAPAIAAMSQRLPVVQLDRRIRAAGGHWVGIDDDAAMSLVLGHLADRGVRSAAFVTSAQTNSSTRDRGDGFARHAEALGIRTSEEWIVRGEFSIASGVDAGRRLLALRARPDAVVCADDLLAFGVLRAARSAGVDVPRRLRVTGFDDTVFAEHVEPALTSVRQPVERMAREVLRMLDESSDVERPEAGTRVALVPSLVVRDST